jgi:YidC/Oxa1 family membrane protein insertase
MDTRRLILVLIFAFSSYMLWENWQKYNQPKPPPVAEAGAAAVSAAPKPSSALQAASPAGSTPMPVDAAPAGETFTVTTDLVKATISTLGGDIVKLELLNYKEHDNKDKTFVLFDAKHHYVAQSGLIGDGLPTHRTAFRRVAGPDKLAEGAKELKVRLEADAANGVGIAKVLTFRRGSYVVDVAWEIANSSDKALTPHAYYQIQRDDIAPQGETAMVSTFTGPAVYTDGDKYQKIAFEDVAKGKAKFTKTADNGWLAMVQHYFVAAFVPKEGAAREYYMRKLDNANL